MRSNLRAKWGGCVRADEAEMAALESGKGPGKACDTIFIFMGGSKNPKS